MPDTENKRIEITQEIGGSTVHARFTVDPRWLAAIEEPIDSVGDGIALTSMESPDWLTEKMAGAIRSGKLGVTKRAR